MRILGIAYWKMVTNWGQVEGVAHPLGAMPFSFRVFPPVFLTEHSAELCSLKLMVPQSVPQGTLSDSTVRFESSFARPDSRGRLSLHGHV